MAGGGIWEGPPEEGRPELEWEGLIGQPGKVQGERKAGRRTALSTSTSGGMSIAGEEAGEVAGLGVLWRAESPSHTSCRRSRCSRKASASSRCTSPTAPLGDEQGLGVRHGRGCQPRLLRGGGSLPRRPPPPSRPAPQECPSLPWSNKHSPGLPQRLSLRFWAERTQDFR